MATLGDIENGSSVKVIRVNVSGALKRRLMDMGFTKGVQVTVRRTAPFGDPIEVELRGYELLLRKADAAMIEVG